MQITITGHQINITPALRKYTEEKVAKVKRYLNATINAHVVLKVEKLSHIAEVTIHANNVDLHGVEKTDNLYAAIDNVMGKIDRQAKKHKGKIQTKRKGAKSTSDSLSAETEL